MATGWQKQGHSYLSRVWKNGKWVYDYGKGKATTAYNKAAGDYNNATAYTNAKIATGKKRVNKIINNLKRSTINKQEQLNRAYGAGKLAYNTTKNKGKKQQLSSAARSFKRAYNNYGTYKRNKDIENRMKMLKVSNPAAYVRKARKASIRDRAIKTYNRKKISRR